MMSEEILVEIRSLREAIRVNDLLRAAELIGANPRLLAISTPFGTCLHEAASLGKLEMVELFLNRGADVNARAGLFDAGALKVAASEGHKHVVEYLLCRGAAIDESDPKRNPLFGAIYGGHLPVVQSLLSHGANVNVRYTGEHMVNMNAIDFAVERGETEIEQLLRAHVRH